MSGLQLSGSVGPRSSSGLALLCLLAGGLGLLSIAVPHDPITTDWAVLATSLAALAVAPLAWRIGRSRPGPILAVGTVLVSSAILSTGGVPNASATLYLWIALYAAYVLPRRHALIQAAFAASAYAAVIALDPPPFPPVAHWTTTAGSIIGATLLVSYMRTRLDTVVRELQTAAATDPLTGLLNRRAFGERLAGELARAQRTGRSFALMIVDVDHFKLANDALGHAGGDEVLRALAAALRSGRRMDVVGRVGGEEFALLLPECGAEKALQVAERLRVLSAERMTRPGLRLTASFGIAIFPDHGPTEDELLHHADQALYAAKRLGRDLAIVYEPGETERVLGGPSEEGDATRQNALVLLAESIDMRDPLTAEHSRTVGRHAAAIARRMGMTPGEVEQVRLAGVLHDVGKLGVPDALLQRPGPLTAAEHELVRRHADLGARLLEGAGMDELARWVRAHHERIDGNGYPAGLAGEEIPLEARILAVADSFEAMTSDRPYRLSMPIDAARAELLRHSGTQFDPRVVAALLVLIERRAAA